MLTPSEKITLSQLFVAYRTGVYPPKSKVAEMWGDWIFENLNGGCKYPLEDDRNKILEGSLSLELIYGWSAFRLSLVIVIPVLLSLAIGIWYVEATADVVAAWTISLYIVTSAAGKPRTQRLGFEY